MSLLTELREATRSTHERLESRLDVLDRCRQPGGYAALLDGFASVYQPLEQAVSACPATPAVVPDWPARSKTPWLAQDLADLGAPLPTPAGVHDVVTAEDVVGSVYVMEGATLGGGVIARELEGLPEPPPHRFFTGYAGRRQPMWHAFRREVCAAEARGLDVTRVVESASRTFAAVERACAGRPS